MAGKRQHYIPQFLQRGFVSHLDEGQAFTWVYRKNSSAPFNSNIKNVGVEGHFYSVQGASDLDADPAITSFEGTLASLIERLRSGQALEASDSRAIAQLFAHLEIRTRHLRRSFLEAGTGLLDELLAFASDSESFGKYFMREIQRNPELMREAMAKEMQKYGIPPQFLPQMMEIASPLLPRTLPGTLAQMSSFANHFRTQLPRLFDQAAKSGHVRGLMRTLAPEPKVNRFQELQFRVERFDATTFPLGDAAVLFHVDGERPFKPFFDVDETLLATVLPIDTHRLLIGWPEHYTVDPERIRQEVARSSLEYFIASGGPPAHDDLHQIVGEGAQLLTRNQIETMVAKLVAE